MQLWPIIQDLNQLKALHKERWETFIANAGVVQGFAPNDRTTSEWMSWRTGETTIVATGFNTGAATNQQGQSMNDGTSYQQTKKRLFLPQELMDLREGAGLIWTAGSSKSVPFTAPPYWTRRESAGRAQSNPYYQGHQ
jgi:type IV secretory pathway TraG/TraD family ATPase VirD4